jgi:hypothetical protein
MRGNQRSLLRAKITGVPRAGNLNNGPAVTARETNAPIILVLDADFAPRRAFCVGTSFIVRRDRLNEIGGFPQRGNLGKHQSNLHMLAHAPCGGNESRQIVRESNDRPVTASDRKKTPATAMTR